MDYLQPLLRALLVASVILLNACTGESDSDEPFFAQIELTSAPLEILGTPPTNLYYDSPFTYVLGAAGGTGAYDLRYVQNPQNIDDEFDVFDRVNPIDMYIENITNAADENGSVKPAFKIEAVLAAPDDVDEENKGSVTPYLYGFELTDGVNLTSKTYEVSVSLNKLKVTTEGFVKEGATYTSSFKNILRAYQNGNEQVCHQVGDFDMERRKVNGVDVFPAVFIVQLDAPVSKQTKILYSTVSSYNEQSSERYDSNIEAARPDVDYITVDSREIIYEKGQSSCIAYIEVIDDGVVEAAENLNIEFTLESGSVVNTETGLKVVTIEDNEPPVEVQSVSDIVNEGEVINIPVLVKGSTTSDIEFGAFIDTAETTASHADYSLTPNNGHVVIPYGNFQGGITLEVMKDSDIEQYPLEDEKIVIRTDLDEINDIDKSEIIINDWVDSVPVASASVSQEAYDFTIDSRNRIITLTSDSSGDNNRVTLDIRNRSGELLEVDGLSGFSLEREGVNFTPVSISFSLGRLAIVSEVDGLVSDNHYGAKDFVVAILALSGDEASYTLDSISQYGTQEDDFVTSVKGSGSTLYVSGYTSGQRLNNEAPDIASRGGVEGFLYKLDMNNNSIVWSRFVGTERDDTLVSMDVGNKDILTLSSSRDVTLNGQVGVISSDSKNNREGLEPPTINSKYDDFVREIKYDSNFSGFMVLADGLGQDSEVSSVGSLTSDVNVYIYTAELETSSVVTYSSPGEDIGTAMLVSEKDSNVVVGGYTDGQFEGQERLGKNDAFIATLNRSGGSTYTKEQFVQFGTSENDRVIAIKQFSDNKYLVLWSEFESTLGHETFRISAFSIEGKMLSSLP